MPHAAPTIAGRQFSQSVDYEVAGGDGRTELRTDMNGARHLISLPGGAPLEARFPGGSENTVSADDAQRLLGLYALGGSFDLILPRFYPDGDAFEGRAALLTRPVVNHVRATSGGAYCTCQFTLTLL